MQVDAVLIQRGHRHWHPAAVPPVRRGRRRFRRVRYSFCIQNCIVIGHILLIERIPAYPDPVVGQERRLVGIHESAGEPVVGLVIRVGPVVGRRIAAQAVVRRHIGREVPGGRQREHVGVLEDEILAPDTGFREPDQPGLLVARGGQVLLDPGDQFLGHEGFVLQIRIIRIIGVPRINRECGLDYRHVVLILRIERFERGQPVPEGGAQARLDREHDEEVVGDAGRGIGRGEHSYRLRAVSVVGGDDVVRLDSLGVRAREADLETGVLPGPVVGGGGAVGHDAGRAAGEGVVTDRDALDAVLQERDGVADRHQLQLRPGRQRPAVVAAQLVTVARVPYEQHQLRAAVVPGVHADVGVLPAALHPHRRTDPLAAGQLGRGHLDLRGLVAGIGFSGPDLAGDGIGRADHHLRGDRHRTIGNGRPVRPQAAVRPVEVVRTGCRRDVRAGDGDVAHVGRADGAGAVGD